MRKKPMWMAIGVIIAAAALLAVAACLIAGFGWICALATLNVSAQAALPEWVRGRGLAIYVTVFFGMMSLGSLIWGFVDNRLGLPAAHYLAAATALLVTPLTSLADRKLTEFADGYPAYLRSWQDAIAASLGTVSGPGHK